MPKDARSPPLITPAKPRSPDRDPIAPATPPEHERERDDRASEAPGAFVVVRGLKSDAARHLNGVVGRRGAFDASRGRWEVHVFGGLHRGDADADVRCKPENLRAATEDEVVASVSRTLLDASRDAAAYDARLDGLSSLFATEERCKPLSRGLLSRLASVAVDALRRELSATSDDAAADAAAAAAAAAELHPMACMFAKQVAGAFCVELRDRRRKTRRGDAREGALAFLEAGALPPLTVLLHRAVSEASTEKNVFDVRAKQEDLASRGLPYDPETVTCILAAEGAKPTSARRLFDAAAADTLKMLCDVMKTEAHAAAALSDDDVEDPTFARALQSFYSACGAAREDDDDDDESETFAMLEHFRALGLEIPPEVEEALRDERATAAAAAAAATAAFASSRKPAMTLCALLRAWATELRVRERLGVEVMPYTEDDDVECVREASAIVERAMKR